MRPRTMYPYTGEADAATSPTGPKVPAAPTAYLHAYIPSANDLTTLATIRTPSIFLRVFTAPVEITRDHYAQYLGFLGHPEHLTDFHVLGSTLDAASIRLHLLAGQVGQKVDGIDYDLVLEDTEEYGRYLAFAKQTVSLEVERPVFTPSGSLHQIPLLTQEITALSDQPTFLIEMCANTNASNISLTTQLVQLAKKYANIARFYRRETSGADLPQLMVRVGNAWQTCDPTDIEKYLHVQGLFTCRLSTGQVLYDTDNVWKRVLGQEAMPAVSIEESLELVVSRLIYKKRGEKEQGRTLQSEQVGIVQTILKNPILRPISMEALFKLFGPSAAPSIHHMKVETNKILPDALDTFACSWDTVKENKVQPLSDKECLQKAKQLLKEFKSLKFDNDGSEVAQQPPQPTHFLYAFKIFLANQIKDTQDVGIITYIDQCTPSFDVGTLGPQHVAHTHALLVPMAKILGDGEEMLEMKLLLSLYANPLVKNSRQHTSQLFEAAVKTFSERAIVRQEGETVGSRAIWEAFLAFLRQHQLDYVGFFGYQTTFNEILRDLGFEQKRLSAGKMWMNVKVERGFTG